MFAIAMSARQICSLLSTFSLTTSIPYSSTLNRTRRHWSRWSSVESHEPRARTPQGGQVRIGNGWASRQHTCTVQCIC